MKHTLTTADINDVNNALRRDTLLEQVQELCTPYRPLEEALQLAEKALGIRSRVEDGVLVLERSLTPFHYIFFTRPGEILAEGRAETAEQFLDTARKVFEAYRADEVFVNVWDETR